MDGEHFNRLTPAEAERLAMLAEEAGEIVQVVGKILRHGYESYHPDNPHSTNRDLLAKEVTDILAVIELMDQDFNVGSGGDIDTAIRKKMRFSHHQTSVGR